MAMAAPETPSTPWHAAYPTPKSQQVESMTCGTLLEMIKNDESVVGRDYALVDLRRVDHEGGTIVGSINLPAQSLYPTIPTLYNLFSAAGVSRVIWYCSSSRGRGTRAAGWFSDYIADRGDKSMHSLILEGGIKAWVAGGADFVDNMDEYVPSVWAGK